MIVPSDKEYGPTKLIKQGQSKIDSQFEAVSNWIHEFYGIKPLNIICDTIVSAKTKTPRLNIVFEHYDEAEMFRNPKGHFYGYDVAKQKKVAEQFVKILGKEEISKIKTWNLKKNGLFDFTRTSDKIFVIFDAFAPVAKIEANYNIPETSIEDLRNTLGANDIWKIYREFSTVVFFFYTKEQMTDCERSDRKSKILDAYYDLIKQYDEFNYVDKATLPLNFDSKESFDKDYQSNWFYYSRR